MFTGWHSTNDSQARYSQNPPHRRGPTEPARADPPIKVTTVSLRDRHDDSISPGLSAQAADDIVVTDSYGSSLDPLFGIDSTNERRVNTYRRSVFPTLTVSRASALAKRRRIARAKNQAHFSTSYLSLSEFRRTIPSKRRLQRTMQFPR